MLFHASVQFGISVSVPSCFRKLLTGSSFEEGAEGGGGGGWGIWGHWNNMFI